MKYIPKYDPNFKPAIIELQNFIDKVAASNEKATLTICLERTKGYNYIYKIDIFKDGTGHDEENYEVVERLVKTILWIAGGYIIYVAGSHYIFERLHADYSKDGKRAFDFGFMSRVYENTFKVLEVEEKDIPALKEMNEKLQNGLNGNRIGFDAGGSDRKVSASIDGKVMFSDETVWFPKINTNPDYHFEGIKDSIERASMYMPTIDSIGVSTAGIVVDNKIMVASLFLKVNEEDFNKKVKTIYIDVAKEFEKKYNKKIPLVVANDGDVTALAGAIELKTDRVLGIAMGTSEAAGYIGEGNALKGWLNELAFAPVDFNKDAMVDEWSGDYGCGVKYFSQDGIIKLAEAAGIKFDEEFSPARKLKYVQDLYEQGDQIAEELYKDVGTYLGYTIAYYAHFYDIKHVLLLGRVVSGKGGNTLLARCRHVLRDEFPNLASRIVLDMPDEKSRRVGQSIAAASLPIIK